MIGFIRREVLAKLLAERAGTAAEEGDEAAAVDGDGRAQDRPLLPE
jgi:hypothetical protein